MLIERGHILKELKNYIDMPVIKVISGIRRCGKSVILQLLHKELLKRGILQEHIIFINFENMEFEGIKTASTLNSYISQKRSEINKTYILLDEIQMVDEWEKAISSFLASFDCDIIITGSNSKLLSGSLATLLAGRFISFEMHPLSFVEYIYFKKRRELPLRGNREELENYIKTGGFPIVANCFHSPDIIKHLISEIYNSVVLQDVIMLNKIRNPIQLERIIRFLFSNVGNSFSSNKIADHLKREKMNINVETVDQYVKALESAYIIHRVSRLDISCKEVLKISEKFFVADHSLIYIKNGYHSKHIGNVLKAIVFLELKRRSYVVFTGKNGNWEIDFVAKKDDRLIYIQVCCQMQMENPRSQELTALMSIKDNFPKYIITTEPLAAGNINGIEIVQLTDFLLWAA